MPPPKADHPLAALFPKLTAKEIEAVVVATKNGLLAPEVMRLNDNQKAMFAARVATPTAGRYKDAPVGEINIKATAALLKIDAARISDAKTILNEGTLEEIAQADAGKLTLMVGREIREGLPPEQRRRPEDGRKKSPSTRRTPPIVQAVLARMAEDEARKKEKRDRDNETRRRRLLAAKPLTLPEMIEALIVASADVTVAEAAALVRGRVDRAKLTALVEWLIELDGAHDKEAAE